MTEQEKEARSNGDVVEYYHCSKCGCKIDDYGPTGSEIRGDMIYCGTFSPYNNNCKSKVKV
jgi:hypothetical protein